MSSVEGKLDDDDDNICPSYSRSHDLCIQYLSSLVCYDSPVHFV